MKHMRHHFTLALILSVFAVGIATLVVSPDVYAATCDENDTTVIECGSGSNGLWEVLLIAMNILTAGVGVLAVGGIVYGAVLWTSGGDNAQQIKKAQGIIQNVVIGIIAFSLLYSGLQFIVPGGVFNRDVGFATVTNTVDPYLNTDSGTSGSDDSGGDGGSGDGGGGDDGGTVTIEDINVRNMRDAAQSSGGSVLKTQTLYRSMMLGNIGPKDTKELSEVMKNGLIIDLRTTAQSNAAPDKDIPGVKNVNIPIAGILDTEPMVSDPTRRAQLAKALKAAANADGPVLIHCAAGKDRTGWMVAMIMYVAGATDAQVMKEYMASNDEEVAGGVKAEWLNSGLKAMREKHGTAKGYLKSIGLSDADIAKLKNKFGA